MDDSNPYAPPHSDPVPSTAAPAPNLWNPDAAGAWSLMFTPVFGSILLRNNWQAIGRDDKVKVARNWLIASIVILIAIIVTNVLTIRVMDVLTLDAGSISLIYIFIWYFAWQKPQSKYVKEQWGKDYPRKSWKKPLLIGFGCWGGFIILYASFF
jgi:hypothetical protein